MSKTKKRRTERTRQRPDRGRNKIRPLGGRKEYIPAKVGAPISSDDVPELNRMDRAEHDAMLQEALRKAPALGVAQTILEGLARPDKDEPSLADRFVAGTYDYAKRFDFTAREAKIIEPVMVHYREDMRRARRFVLDDDLTRYITELAARLTPEKALQRLRICTLPYDICWVEHDLPVKVRTMRALAPPSSAERLDPDLSAVGKRLGLLLYRISDEAMGVQLVGETSPDHVGANMSSYLVSLTPVSDFLKMPKGHTGMQSAHTYVKKYEDEAGLNPRHHRDDDRVDERNMSIPWGYHHVDGKPAPVPDVFGTMATLRLPAELDHLACIGFGRLYEPWRQIFIQRAGLQRAHKHLYELITQEWVEFTGIVRWIAALLSVLNDVPTIRRGWVQPTGKIRTGLTAHRPFFDYHKLTLVLPKRVTDAPKYLEREFARSSRRHKQHDVRQHWRTFLEVEHCGYYDHDWVYDYENGYRLCGKCMSKSTLIPEHLRGDPALGRVTKDYVLKKDPTV